MKKTNSIIETAEHLIDCHKLGKLGGDVMPEDKNPGYAKASKENYLYFTLPMALNYQRSAYKLWEAAHHTALDADTSVVYNPLQVGQLSDVVLREKLLKYKVALQPNKQPVIWRTLCQTFTEMFEGDVRQLFKENQYRVDLTKTYMLKNKRCFPYLSGTKIMNYWLYVLTQYTDLVLEDRWNITIAPDTHVLKASVQLGVITEEELAQGNVQQVTAARWQQLLSASSYDPIDLHTPLWLWSRAGFPSL